MWVSALDDAAKEKYDDALEKLSKVESLMGEDAEFNLLRGFLCFATNDDSGVMNHMSKAIGLLEDSQKYSGDEKRYLICYARIWMGKTSECEDDSTPLEAGDSICNFSDINLSKVKNALKQNFPLRQHPEWVSEEIK